MINKIVIIVTVLLIASYLFNPTVEHAAGSPGALIQLATSSTYPDSQFYVRPVRQRGMHYYYPSWNRFDNDPIVLSTNYHHNHSQEAVYHQPGMVPEQYFPWFIIGVLILVIILK